MKRLDNPINLNQEKFKYTKDIFEIVERMIAGDYSKKIAIEYTKTEEKDLVVLLNSLNDKLLLTKLESNLLDKKAQQIENYKLALDQSSILVVTDLKGNIQYVNKMFCKISGYSKEELIGQNQSIVNSGHHPKDFWKKMWATIGKGEVWHGEIKNKAKNGHFYWVDTTIVPFANREGRIEKYVAIRNDITDKKQKEEELHVNNLKLEQINHNLKRFAHTLAHDIKSPINSAQGLLQLIKQNQEIGNHTETAKYVELLEDVIGSSKDFIDEVLKFALDNSEAERKESVDVNELLRKIKKRFSVEQNVVFKIEKMPVIECNKLSLKQIFNNILSNAIKFNNKEQCIIAIEYVEHSFSHEFIVRDNGPGIKKSDVNKVFNFKEILESTNEESTGVGLSIVQRMVQDNAGSIWINPEYKIGAEFHFTVPRSTTVE